MADIPTHAFPWLDKQAVEALTKKGVSLWPRDQSGRMPGGKLGQLAGESTKKPVHWVYAHVEALKDLADKACEKPQRIIGMGLCHAEETSQDNPCAYVRLLTVDADALSEEGKEAMAGSRVTVPDVLPLFRAYYAVPGNACGGSLHIVVDERNVGDEDVRYCIAYARRRGDDAGLMLGYLLLAMSQTQRRKIAGCLYGDYRPKRAGKTEEEG